MKKEIIEPIQNWLPIEDIFENGNNYYIEGIHNNETRINICSEL